MYSPIAETCIKDLKIKNNKRTWHEQYWTFSRSIVSFLKCGYQIARPYSSMGRTWVLYKSRRDSGEQWEEKVQYIYPRSLSGLQKTLSMCLDHVRSFWITKCIFKMAHLLDLSSIEWKWRTLWFSGVRN